MEDLQGYVETVMGPNLDKIVTRHFKRVDEEVLFTGDFYRNASPERIYEFSPQRLFIAEPSI